MAEFPPFTHHQDNQEEDKMNSSNSTVHLKNPHIEKLAEDVLYHLALSNKANNLPQMFSEVKFVCFGGSPTRMKRFADQIVEQLNYKIPAGQTLSDISGCSDRYVLYKVGPVLSVSHGMGIPSLSIVFNEILKMLHHAGCSDVKFFRLGTSGGLGLEPGTVVISEAAVDGMLRPYMEIVTLGKIVQHPAVLDKDLCLELLDCAKEEEGYTSTIGKTMCTYDFYEGQARLNGAFCDYTEEDKMAFLKRIHHDRGILNIEMESLCFAATAHRAGVKSAILCSTLLDRLKGDQNTASNETLEEWQDRPLKIIAKYIRKQLGLE